MYTDGRKHTDKKQHFFTHSPLSPTPFPQIACVASKVSPQRQYWHVNATLPPFFRASLLGVCRAREEEADDGEISLTNWGKQARRIHLSHLFTCPIFPPLQQTLSFHGLQESMGGRFCLFVWALFLVMATR